jgi:hypothetical protein
MKKKDKLRLVAHCGIYCGLCSSRNRMPQQAQALRQTMWNGGWDSLGREVKDFKEFWRFLDRISDPEKSCPGCRTAGAPPFCGGPESCDIRQCALGRKVELCVNCSDWPCARIERLGRTYVTLIADGRRLKKIGLDKWLKEQEARAETGFSYCDIRPPKGGDMTGMSDIPDRVPSPHGAHHKDTKTRRERPHTRKPR